jgi:hypothetical protein
MAPAKLAGPRGLMRGCMSFRLSLMALVFATLSVPALAEPTGDGSVPQNPPAATATAPAPSFSGDLAHALETPGLPQNLASLGLDSASLDGFYKSRPVALWVNDQGINANGQMLLDALWKAATAGCHNVANAVAHAQGLAKASTTPERVELELTLTGALAEAAFAAVAPFRSNHQG